MPNPWLILGALSVTALLCFGSFLYGQRVERNAIKAGQLDAVTDQFNGFYGKVQDAAKAGTEQANADFAKRMATLDRLANNLRTAQGIMNNAASQLSNSLRGGACVLTSEQRRMLECVRRPDATACAAAVP